MFICEMLCFIQNNYGKIPKNDLLSIVHGFYDDDEAKEAKEMLFDWASTIDGTPRAKTRKDSTNRRRLECEDILGLVEFLDKKKIELPVFVAVKLHRVPKMTPSDIDTVNLAETVADLKQQVSVLATQLQQVSSMVSSINVIASRRPGDKGMENAAKMPDGAKSSSFVPDGAADCLTDKSVASFADLMQATDESPSDQWFTVVKNKSRSTRRIVGSNQDKETAIKAVGRQSWHVFVGRLQPSTTEDDMSKFLADSGINVVKCSLLKKTEKWQEKYAAFRLVVDINDKDKVFDDVMWPSGVDVRDWVFSSSRHG